MGYVVAFNRNRDFYQVPLALFERGLLAKLVTDFYVPDLLAPLARSWAPRAARRRVDGLPSRAVRSNLKALWYQLVELRLHKGSAASVFTRLDDTLSEVALAEAGRDGADLFLYSQYAYKAFTSGRSQGRVKGLFMFHPDVRLNRDVLRTDFDSNPECRWSIDNEEDTSGGSPRMDRPDAEWRLADFVVCASDYTARSLTHAGCEASKITVVPYGIDAGSFPFEAGAKGRSTCRFLFVGQGMQRKGLHHLLKAWRNLKLADAHLTVVSSRLDPGIARLAPDGVTILARQSPEDLRRRYAKANVFVLPSLVEGFGLVFLEALASGCYCVGTGNTGLADLCPPHGVGGVVAPGSTQEVERGLLDAYRLHRAGGIDHGAVRDFALTLPWSSFRRSVADVAGRFSRSRGAVVGVAGEAAPCPGDALYPGAGS